ncbi:MAG: methyltransferase domain-containing protein [Actinoplanes sp.]
MSYVLSAEAAEFYESAFVPALFDAWAHKLVGLAGVRAGESVLDVACGTGAVARVAADAGGLVTGVDVSEAMLAVARRVRPGPRWERGEAEALPYADGSFDVVLSQAALMFFADRVGALREMGRVGGRVAVQVPGRLARSPGYLALTSVVARHAGADAAGLIDGYFSVGEPDLLRGLFASARLRIEGWETWGSATRLGSLDEFLAVELLPLADRVPGPVRERIVADCRAAMAEFRTAGGGVAAPLEVHAITARRP